jgi:MoxR-like ATPase
MLLQDELKPLFFFFKTIDDSKGNRRAVPLQGQKIPDETGENYFISTETAFVQCPKPMRSNYPLGTIFGCKEMEQVTSKNGNIYYWAKGKEDSFFPLNSFPALMRESYDNFKSLGVARPNAKAPTPVVKKPKQQTTISDDKFIHQIARDYPFPTIEEDGYYIAPHTWLLMVRNALKGENTLILGPSGSAKTELIELLAKRIGKKSIAVDMSSKQDPIASLVGAHRIKNGASIFDPAPFTNYIQQDCILNLDELNRAPLQANNLLLPLLDRRRELALDVATSEEDRVIKVNKDLVFFATANVGSAYTGVNDLDRAVVDRFRVIRLAYPPIEEEAAILVKRTSCDYNAALVVARIAHDIRKLHDAGELSTGVSVRHTLNAGELLADGYQLIDALEAAFVDYFLVEEKATLLDIFSKY